MSASREAVARPARRRTWRRTRGGVRHRMRAFTLIEVLVAMTIIAVGVSALVASAGASAWRADYLRERELARWVASNALAEREALPAWPDPGTTNTETEMARTRWFVRTRTRAVADPDLRRLDIEVRKEKDSENYLYSVTGFVGNPEIRLSGSGGGADDPSSPNR